MNRAYTCSGCDTEFDIYPDDMRTVVERDGMYPVPPGEITVKCPGPCNSIYKVDYETLQVINDEED